MSDDSISRQAAIDALTEYGNGRAVFISVGEAVIRMEQLPSAQPEIIRCKDCKYHRYEHDKTGDIPYCSNADYGYGWKDNDFCSKGKRRTDE